jgi:hypothetical protein
MLCFVEYGKGYHIAKLESMGTIFARTVACTQSLKFGRILQGVLQKSIPQQSTIIEGHGGHQNHGGPSQEDGGQISRRHLPPMTNMLKMLHPKPTNQTTKALLIMNNCSSKTHIQYIMMQKMTSLHVNL